jgi:hypothetical protein
VSVARAACLRWLPRVGAGVSYAGHLAVTRAPRRFPTPRYGEAILVVLVACLLTVFFVRLDLVLRRRGETSRAEALARVAALFGVWQVASFRDLGHRHIGWPMYASGDCFADALVDLGASYTLSILGSAIAVSALSGRPS